MQGVSFRSTYAIPQAKSQNPTLSRYQSFLQESYPLRKKGEAPVYDGTKKEQYITVAEDNNGINDRTFENLAAFYNIRIKKLNPTEAEAVKSSKGRLSEADKTKLFVAEAVAKGAKNTTTSKDGIKTVVLYDEDEKTIFGVYKFDEKNNNRLVKEYSYVNGQPDRISSYNNNGEREKVVIINQDKKLGIGIDAKVLKTVY